MGSGVSPHCFEDSAARGLRRSLWLALGLILLLVGGVGGWAATTRIAGAVIAPGKIVVDTSVKTVKHRDGGIVRTIHVRDGDVVAAGDVLIALDDTVVRTELAIIKQRLHELQARQARLLAERDDALSIKWLDVQDDLTTTDDQLIAILAGQTALMNARRASLDGRRVQLREQISQIRQQIVGLEAQRDAKTTNLTLVEGEITDIEALRAKGLTTDAQVIALKRDRSGLAGDRGDLVARIAQAREAISERRIQMLQLSDTFREQVLVELQDVRIAIAQLSEQKITAEDRLQRTLIRSPRNGIVHQLQIHTVDGVIGPGETIVLIVPRDDVLRFEVGIRPTDIDQVRIGQMAILRFSAFDQRSAPELAAEVAALSPDLAIDTLTNTPIYLARLSVRESELARLRGRALVPGMPVEAHIRTEPRTVLSYLLKPLTDQIARTFRET